MATWSVFFTDTTVPGPQVGDGRPYTAAEWRILYKYLWARGNADKGVLKGVLNECVVTATGANALQVDTGIVVVNGGAVVMETAEALAPTSAPAGQTRKDSVIAQLDLDGSGVGQYKVRVKVKSGTAGAYPALTQNAATVWEQRLYNYTIDDAGAITGISDQRQYLSPAGQFDHGEATGLLDDDHTQYMDVAGVRHTKAVHDALGIDAATVGGFSAATLMGGVALGFQGVMVLWGGTIGGSDGHRPVSGGSAHEDWHVANGQLVNGVQTIDMTDRVPIGAGNTYVVNAAGGAAALNLQHGHTEGTLDTANESSHTHGKGNYSSSVQPDHTHFTTGSVDIDSHHTHDSGGGHFHALDALVTSGPSITETGGGSGNSFGADIHTHTINNKSTGAVGGHVHGPGAGHSHSINLTSNGGGSHSHSIASGNSSAGTAHSHGIAGTTANALSATQSILPPYRGVYFITYVG